MKVLKRSKSVTSIKEPEIKEPFLEVSEMDFFYEIQRKYRISNSRANLYCPSKCKTHFTNKKIFNLFTISSRKQEII